jgi:transcriptional regulator with XRE-family HTH domain
MGFMSGKLGERIAARRQQLGWSQIQLASAAGLTPSAISLFESEKRKPSFEALKKLSDALGVSTDYLTDDRPGAPPSDATDPRLKGLGDALTLLGPVERDQLVQVVLGLLSHQAGGTVPVEVPEDPIEAARAVLDRFGIHYPPVDPLLVACLLGLSVRMAPLVELDCEAMLDRRITPPLFVVARPEIEPGRSFNDNRLRFTVAQVLGHYVLPHHRAQTYRCRKTWVEADRDPAEAEAKAFAAELLMSAPMLARVRSAEQAKQDADSLLESAKKMAGRFKTSIPVGVLQYVKYSDLPCAAIRTEGGQIREVAVSASFEGELVREVPPGALCLTTRGEKGNRWRDCAASEWLVAPKVAVLREEAFHYLLQADQSITVLSEVKVSEPFV